MPLILGVRAARRWCVRHPNASALECVSARRLAAAKATQREDLVMFACQCNAMHRRDVVCGGGAALFSAVVATLIGSEKPVRAETGAGKEPEIDRVAVR